MLQIFYAKVFHVDQQYLTKLLKIAEPNVDTLDLLHLQLDKNNYTSKMLASMVTQSSQ